MKVGRCNGNWKLQKPFVRRVQPRRRPQRHSSSKQASKGPCCRLHRLLLCTVPTSLPAPPVPLPRSVNCACARFVYLLLLTASHMHIHFIQPNLSLRHSGHRRSGYDKRRIASEILRPILILLSGLDIVKSARYGASEGYKTKVK